MQIFIQDSPSGKRIRESRGAHAAQPRSRLNHRAIKVDGTKKIDCDLDKDTEAPDGERGAPHARVLNRERTEGRSRRGEPRVRPAQNLSQSENPRQHSQRMEVHEQLRGEWNDLILESRRAIKGVVIKRGPVRVAKALAQNRNRRK